MNADYKYWQVLLPRPMGDLYDYTASAEGVVTPGSIVRVPFGREELTGVVWAAGLSGDWPADKIKPMAGVWPLPPISPALRQMVDFTAQYTMQPRGLILKMVLAEKSVFIPPKRESTRKPAVALGPYSVPLTHLSPHQENAVGVLRQAIAQQKFAPILLRGVTGSGKTETYAQAIADVMAMERQALVLLPEIALSAQMLGRFTQLFGAAPMVWHSQLTPAQRRENYRAIMDGRARLILGARSALFLPYQNLGLIVVDEEHDGSYKQEEGVQYHARDLAVYRARAEKIPVILASATPSLETQANVLAGKYQQAVLPERYGQSQLPTVTVLDLRAEKLPRGRFVSDRLIEVLRATTSLGQQSLIFLNRRGYAPLTLCRACGHRVMCKRCSAWLVEHQKTKKLHCHHCGYAAAKPNTCPQCKALDSLHPIGPGVERVAEEVQKLLPDLRLAVMSSDLTDDIAKVAGIVQGLESGALDAVVGTQMLAKGYDFPKLSTVVVVDADLGLMGGDLRAAERTYQLLQQVAGRSGRREIPGQVWLQSYMPDHPVLQAIARGDDEAFYNLLLDERKILSLPPFGKLASVVLWGRDEVLVNQYAAALARAIPVGGEDLHILGPAPAPLQKLRGMHRVRFLIKAGKTINIQAGIDTWLRAAPALPRALRLQVDIDPYSFG